MTTHEPAHRVAEYAVTRPAVTPRETSGPASWWPDGVTTYVLRYRGSAAIEHVVAGEADTVLAAIEALRTPDADPAFLGAALVDVRRLQGRLAALADELLLYAREDGPDGRPRMTFRAIGDATGQHHTTVAERHGRVVAGEFADWRHWLVQDTPREHAYPQDARKRTRPAHIAKGGHQAEVYDYDTTSGEVYARCVAAGCTWETEPMASTVTAAMLGTLHESDPVNLALRTNVGPWDAAQPADADLCGRRHPSGDTTCARPYRHDRAPEADKRGQHCDAIGRTWTEDR